MKSPRRTTETNSTDENPYRVLPQVSSVVDELAVSHISPDLRARIVRETLEDIRVEIESGERPSAESVLDRCRAALQALSEIRFEEIVNGTGIVLHTNLGRAPVSEATAAAMAMAAGSYLSLEIDPISNRRGGRMDEICRLLHALTGAESTLVVNNNAAAVLLTLAALCAGRDVIVSRGEAIEIGGGFRIPEVVRQSGCRLIEVATTNRTYASDYLRARSESTGAFLKVHPSNFRVEGFVSTPQTAELAAVATEHGTILIEDLGSGAMLDTAGFGLRREPTVAEALSAGAAIVTFSGDKLLGGPQAGIICGRADLLRIIERHPLARTVRVDKTILAGLAATLRHYVAGDAERTIPIWQMLGASAAELERRAAEICSVAGGEVVQSISSVGGGSLPGETLPSMAISLATHNADELARCLRTGTSSVFPIIRDRSVLVDMRAVRPHQDRQLADAIIRAVERSTRE